MGANGLGKCECDLMYTGSTKCAIPPVVATRARSWVASGECEGVGSEQRSRFPPL